MRNKEGKRLHKLQSCFPWQYRSVALILCSCKFFISLSLPPGAFLLQPKVFTVKKSYTYYVIKSRGIAKDFRRVCCVENWEQAILQLVKVNWIIMTSAEMVSHRSNPFRNVQGFGIQYSTSIIQSCCIERESW